MNPEHYTVAQVYARLNAMIRQRNDTGFRLAVSDALLEPRNPFESAKRRRPKLPVAIALSLLVVLAFIFVYFSFWPGR
jgi:hypothetical protein